MKRDDTKKNFTALSGNDLKTVHLHYLSFPCVIAFVTISEVCRLMRYGSVINALFAFFAPRTVILKEKWIYRLVVNNSLYLCIKY